MSQYARISNEKKCEKFGKHKTNGLVVTRWLWFRGTVCYLLYCFAFQVTFFVEKKHQKYFIHAQLVCRLHFIKSKNDQNNKNPFNHGTEFVLYSLESKLWIITRPQWIVDPNYTQTQSICGIIFVMLTMIVEWKRLYVRICVWE